MIAGIVTFLIVFAIGFKLFNKKKMKRENISVTVNCYILPKTTLKDLSDNEIINQMKSAVKKENYEHAQKCKDELERRGVDTLK